MTIDVNKLRAKLLESKASDVLVFTPSRDQALAKANFWAQLLSSGVQVPQTIDLGTAISMGAYRGIGQWWTIPGFPEWFANQDEFRQKLEFLSNVSLDHLEKLLHDEKANANAKVAAIKLIMELSRKLKPEDTDAQYLDKKIAEMDRAELERFIQSKISLVK